MKTRIIDINCDVGEGLGNEAELMPYISSCNIACGGHAGDVDTMRQVVRLAKRNKVKIGAHPSFPDNKNFGREVLDMSCAALFKSLEDQISVLLGVLREEHEQLHHIKPHGALYNVIVKDKERASVVVEVMRRFHMPLKLYVPYMSLIADLAKKAKIPVTYEAFADRNYNSDLTLVSRKMKNALISNSDLVFEHVKRMLIDHKVLTIDGSEIDIMAETICVHGDSPNAIQLVKELNRKLVEHNFRIG